MKGTVNMCKEIKTLMRTLTLKIDELQINWK
jgi:hypothetical protein